MTDMLTGQHRWIQGPRCSWGNLGRQELQLQVAHACCCTWLARPCPFLTRFAVLPLHRSPSPTLLAGWLAGYTVVELGADIISRL